MSAAFLVRYVSLLGVLLISGISYAVQPGGRVQVTIVAVQGLVDAQKAGEQKWISAQKGMALSAGDSVRTAIDSTADIAFDDGSVVRINEETTLFIDGLSLFRETGRFLYCFDRDCIARRVDLKLQQGSVYASVRELPNSLSQFTVETPRGIAGVRGTNWTVGEKMIGVVSGFIDWVPRKAIGKPPGGNIIAGMRRFAAGGRSAGMDRYDYIRINEGGIADVDPDGSLRNLRVMKDAMAARICSFVERRAGPQYLPTHSQVAATEYFTEQLDPADGIQIDGQGQRLAEERSDVAARGGSLNLPPARQSTPQ